MRDEVKVRAPAGYPHRVTDIQGDAQVGLLPHLSPGPSSSFSRGQGHPERLHPFPKDQNRLGLLNMCSGGLFVHRLEPSQQPSLLPWSPSQPNPIPTSRDYSTKDADHLQEGKQDWAYVIKHLTPLVQPSYTHKRENEEDNGPCANSGRCVSKDTQLS